VTLFSSFLTPEVQLCDCPGLVFPALDRPKALQILCGLFPLAQVREPYSAVRYLAERVPLERVYGLRLPDDAKCWSPYNICEALAVKRGYLLAKSGRPDAHRAGREILIDALDGRVVISWPPPGSQERVEQHFREQEASKPAPPAAVKEDTEAQLLADRVTRQQQKKEKKLLRRYLSFSISIPSSLASFSFLSFLFSLFYISPLGFSCFSYFTLFLFLSFLFSVSWNVFFLFLFSSLSSLSLLSSPLSPPPSLSLSLSPYILL
jgi:hypothetical protein